MAVAGAAVALAVGGYLIWFAALTLEPGTDTYTVEPGASLRGFSRQLHARGVLPDPYTLVLWAHVRGESRAMRAGEYQFRNGISPLGLLDQIVAGQTVQYPLKLIEGWSFKQVMQATAAAPRLRHTLDGLRPEEIMTRLGHAGVHPEGRFFPDTYHYTTGTTDVALLQRAYEKMRVRLQEEWDDRAPGLPLKTPDEALALASIVEKETGAAVERPLIAAVFMNRLRQRMRLQTDPTVIYGMGDAFRGNIRVQDLRTDTPYNTYTRDGLPPTPIAMPSGEALHAALHPAEARALYFVSRGDGTHHFSETLTEHNNAVIRYQLGGKPRPFSSYPPNATATNAATPAKPAGN